MTWLSRPCADLQFEVQFSLMVVAGTLFSKIIAGSQTCPVLIMHCKVYADDIVLYMNKSKFSPAALPTPLSLEIHYFKFLEKMEEEQPENQVDPNNYLVIGTIQGLKWMSEGFSLVFSSQVFCCPAQVLIVCSTTSSFFANVSIDLFC
ncbi:hypothetical protein REPUB_Repub05bG0173900 [Reevesia pubescens]